MHTKDSCLVNALGTKGCVVQMATFKRPLLKERVREPLIFTTKWQGGAQVSEWAPDTRKHIIASGTPGRVGEIVDLVNKGGPAAFRKTPWSPPHDLEFYIKKMISEEDQEAYAAKCKAWHEAHPPKEYKKPPPLPEYNRELIAKFWQGKTSMPPLEDRVKVFRAAGLPEERIKKHINWDKKMKETVDERQRAIDAVFGKYSASKTSKSKTKVVEKVIKPVKKKMN